MTGTGVRPLAPLATPTAVGNVDSIQAMDASVGELVGPITVVDQLVTEDVPRMRVFKGIP